MKEHIVVIVGPTAVGKTEYAIAAAKSCNGEIISADSMQLYRYLDIGSAKPTPEEQKEAVHHLINEIDPQTPFSAAEYQKRAKFYIAQVLAEHKLPIIAGGTGLYVNSLLYDMDFSITPGQKTYRESLEKEALLYGNGFVHEKLERLDSKGAERIHKNNLKKVIRALERIEAGETEVKEFKESFVKTQDYDCLLIGLTRDREELYARIDQRVDNLMEKGLKEEVSGLLDRGLTQADISMKGIGYKELIGYLNGSYDLEEGVRLIKRNSRHYAKRQLTWFSRYPEIKWFNLSSYQTSEEGIDAMCTYIHKYEEQRIQK